MVDPECSVIPEEDMKSSLMFNYKSDEVNFITIKFWLSFIYNIYNKKKIDGYCDDGNDKEYKHNPNSHTKQNLKCNRRSVMDVIMSHKDFR
jgi:hypothetical protein